MQQSLCLTKCMYQSVHRGIDACLGKTKWASELAQDAFDILSLYLPLGESWLHEEWHRAVLSSNGIYSYDEVYNFNFLAQAIKVSRVSDEDLVRLKRERPQDFVRLSAAGIEAQYEHSMQLSRDRFFYDANPYAKILNIASIASCIAYLGLSTFPYADNLTDEMNREDGANITSRDFAGLDFTAWVYDLYRPQEPFAARGAHPSGVGINRYIKTASLSADQIRFLRLQAGLSLLNLADPILYGKTRFEAKSPFGRLPCSYNFSLHHFLTSFGYAVDCTAFFKQDVANVAFTLHNYANANKYYPGIELELLQYPLLVKGTYALTFSPRISAWVQPLNQEFWTSSYAGGGLAAATVTFPVVRQFASFLEVEAKTAGWVAGNVHLDPSVGGRIGVSLVTKPRGR